MHHSIFDKQPDRTDFDRIGVSVITPFVEKNRWVFRHEGGVYDMAPAGVTDAALSPVVLGADRLIRVGCSLKEIPNPEAGFNLLFSQEQFPGCDVKLSFREARFDGWVYDVESVNLPITPGQQAWICPYMKFYFQEPPATLYLKMEAK